MGWCVIFSGGVAPWLGVTIAVLALAVTLASYLWAGKAASRGHMLFLTSVRMFGVVLVLILVLRPLVTYRIRQGRQEHLTFLVDTSRSMGLCDFPDLPSRLDGVKAALASDSPQMKALAQNFKLDLYTFDEVVNGQTPPGDVAALQAKGEATKICDALNAIAAKAGPEDPGRIVLFSDGIDTSGCDNTRETAYTGNVPVVAVGVGSKLSAEGSFKDIILSAVEVLPAGEPVVSKDTVARIVAYVEGLGYPGLVVPVRLEDSSGRVVTQENVILDTRRGNQKIVLPFTPTKKGNFKYTVKVAAQAGETILENNSRNLNITVTDPEIRVLYVEGTLRWEYRYLKRILERDPNMRLVALVRLSEKTFYQQGNCTDIELTGFPRDIETLKKFNVILVGDLDASAFSAQDRQNIRKAVYEGTGLMMLGGYNSFSPGYADTPLAEILPVTIDPVSGSQDKNEFVPQLTDQGEVSPIFAGITDYFPGPGRQAVHQLPGLLGQVRLGRPKPGASVLAVNPLRNDSRGPLQVLVVQNFGAGRTAAFAGDTTWRWYAPMKGLGLESPYVRFWGQMIRWLARREAEQESGKPGVEAWLDKAFYALGDKVAIEARVRASDGLLTDGAAVKAAIGGPEKLQLPLGKAAGTAGAYEASFRPSRPGVYTLTVSAALDGKALGEMPLAFEVGKEDVEMRRIDLDEGLLRSIAAASGGSYVPLVDFPSFVANLQQKETTEKTVEFLNLRQKKVLYPLFLLFIALVTIEWVWRKRLQLP